MAITDYSVRFFQKNDAIFRRGAFQTAYRSNSYGRQVYSGRRRRINNGRHTFKKTKVISVSNLNAIRLAQVVYADSVLFVPPFPFSFFRSSHSNLIFLTISTFLCRIILRRLISYLKLHSKFIYHVSEFIYHT